MHSMQGASGCACIVVVSPLTGLLLPVHRVGSLLRHCRLRTERDKQVKIITACLAPQAATIA